MWSLENIRRLWGEPRQAATGPAAVEAALPAMGDDPSSELPDLQRLIKLHIERGEHIPDDIHERALRLELAVKPFDLELTRSLAALLHQLDRPPLPEPTPAGAGQAGLPGDDIDALVNAACAHARSADLFLQLAGLWQACVRHPADPRGFSEYARAFAERYEWANCRLAVARALAMPEPPGRAAADALLVALAALAEQDRLDGLDWKSWFERLPKTLRVNAHAVRLLVALADRRAGDLVPPLIRARPESAQTWLSACMAAFEQEHLLKAYDCLRRALEIDTVSVLHSVIRDWSAQVSRLLYLTGKGSELVAWLSERYTVHPELNLIPSYPAAEALLAARRRRESALDRGLPPFLFVALYKSASATLSHIVCAGFDLPTVLHSLPVLQVVPPWLQDFLRGGSSYTTHLLGTRSNVDAFAAAGTRQIIVHVRDPRQVVISTLAHMRRYPRELSQSARQVFAGDERDRINAAIELELPRTITWIEQWMAAESRLGVEFTDFGDFVRDRKAFVDRLLDLYGGDTRYFNRDLAFHEPESTDFHRRRGEVDEWRRLLDAEQTRRVNELIPDAIWSKFGWSP
jgi:hypothetical protein